MLTPRPILSAIGLLLVAAAFAVDWIGLSNPENFGAGQIVLLSAGMVLVLASWALRERQLRSLRTVGRRLAGPYRSFAMVVLNTIVLLAVLETGAKILTNR